MIPCTYVRPGQQGRGTLRGCRRRRPASVRCGVRRGFWLATMIGLALVGAADFARADVASPGQRIVPAELVFTGLGDVPGYRFVLAAIPLPAEDVLPGLPQPAPVDVVEGVAVAASTTYFQQLRALPPDAPKSVSDAWLASSKAPSSGMVTRRPWRVPETSPERVVRASYRVQQVRAGWIATELQSVVATMADGSDRVLARAIPRSWSIASVRVPPGWELYWMAHPEWPAADPPLPSQACSAGDDLPLSPGPRTLVAVEGGLGENGTVAGRPFAAWDAHVDEWGREGVAPESPAIAQRMDLEVEVRVGQALSVGARQLYEDKQGQLFDDPEGEFEHMRPFRVRWAVGAASVLTVALAGGGLWLHRRRRARRA